MKIYILRVTFWFFIQFFSLSYPIFVVCQPCAICGFFSYYNKTFFFCKYPYTFTTKLLYVYECGLTTTKKCEMNNWKCRKGKCIWRVVLSMQYCDIRQYTSGIVNKGWWNQILIEKRELCQLYLKRKKFLKSPVHQKMHST